MAQAKRINKASPGNRSKSFISVMEAIDPAFPLDMDEGLRFEEIIAARERETWNKADIATATHMAQVEIERDRVRDMYQAEGLKIEDHNGKPIINPLFTAYNTLFGQADKLRRSLGLTAAPRGISGPKQARRNQQDAVAAEKVSSLSSLIAKPRGN